MARPLGILRIPSELTEHALVLSQPRDVARFAQTCRSARTLVYEARDQHLWRRLFLEQNFDDPRLVACGIEGGSEASIDWKKELQKRVYAVRVIQKINAHPPLELKDALRTLIAVVRRAPPLLTKSGESQDLLWVGRILREHNLLDYSRTMSLTLEWEDEEQQRLAELWSIIGWREAIQSDEAAALFAARNTSRCFVYDMRNYIRESNWGPFLPDKSNRVNWKHIQAIITVMYCNLKDLGGLWSDTRPPMTLNATRAYSAPGMQDRDPRDWAGVEGTWRRYVCFMDYRDLFTFNFSTGAYEPDFFMDDDFQEATRLIELTLRITRVADSTSSSSSSSPYATSSNPSQFPVIHFAGTSRGGNGNEAKVRGFVRMSPDGHIRWRFASIYDGHSQWSSDGIQIGNVGSAAGIVGTWTGANHEEGDPAGPFWLWKVDHDHPSHLHTPPAI